MRPCSGSSLEDRCAGARPDRSPGSRIVLLPAPSRPRGQWLSAGFVPDYSDGVAAVFNRLPWAPLGIPGANYAVTVAESCRDRNGRLVVDSVSLRTSCEEERTMELERRDFLKLTAGALTYALAAEPTWAQTAKVEVHWLGQASTKLTTLTGKVIVIDPFLTGNPKTPPQYKSLDALGKVAVAVGDEDHVDLAERVEALVLRRRLGVPREEGVDDDELAGQRRELVRGLGDTVNPDL